MVIPLPIGSRTVEVEATESSPPRILLVDDEGPILRSYARLLRSVQAHIIPVESAEEALAVMKTTPADVVISDYRLPGMDGGQLLQAVREGWPEAVRILITGAMGSSIGPDAIDESIRSAEIHRFLLKPCDPNELRSAVADALRRVRPINDSPVKQLDEPARRRVYEQAFEKAMDLMMIADLAGNLVEVNEAFVRSLGGVRQTALARRPTLLSGWDIEWEEVNEVLERNGRWCEEVLDRTNDRYALLDISIVCGEGSKPVALSAIERDLTPLRRTEKESISVQQNLLLAFSNLAEFRDPETGAHLRRIRCYSRALSLELARSPRFAAIIDADFVQSIYLASPLHDVGKVAIPDDVLLKPGKLTDKEFAIMKTHSKIGAEILARVAVHHRLGFLHMAELIALQHHEKFDGSGYPDGLRGDQIDIAARVVALADVYDAMTSNRVYRKAGPHSEAREVIVRGEGTHFDPEVVQAFRRAEDIFQEIRQANAEQPDAPAFVEGRRSTSQILRTINSLLEEQRTKRLKVWG